MAMLNNQRVYSITPIANQSTGTLLHGSDGSDQGFGVTIFWVGMGWQDWSLLASRARSFYYILFNIIHMGDHQIKKKQKLFVAEKTN